jgi:type I restriction enzyme S subunit
MNEIKTVSFSDFGAVITGKTPSSSSPEDFGTEIPFVTPSDSFDSKYIIETSRFLSKEGAKKLNGKILPKDSVLVTCIGSAMGKIAMVSRESVTNQQINSIVINENFDPHYVYYCLVNNYKLIRNAAGGSTALPLLNKTEFELLKCSVHSLKEDQLKVAKVLSALDSKIELNNRINAELEAMAKTLYDYWFVQFDFPFDFAQGKPDANGKPYKTSGGKMAYNPILKRKIPDGWEVTKIGKIAKTVLGGTPDTGIDEYWKNADIPWLSSAEIASFPVITSEQKTTQKGIENSAATLLPKGTVVISIVRYIRPSILGIDAATNQSVVGIKECSRLKSTFIYPYFCSEVPRLMGLRTGAQQPHINKGVIEDCSIVLPPDYILESYYEITTPIYEQVMNLAFQNHELIKLRDWLLPMLMNGQVTIK